MLLGNYNLFNYSPGRAIGGTTDPTIWRKFGSKNNFYYGDANVAEETDKSAWNNGYAGESAWHLSPKAGGLSTFNEINGEGSLAGNAAMGINIEADLSGVGTISAAALSMVVGLAATLAGTGSVSASLVGSVSLAATLLGTGSVTAGLNLLANCIAALSGTGSVASSLRGTASMEADIYVNEGTASVVQMAAGVWNAVAASYNDSGTMGEKMNAAGTAGDPWTTDLSGYTTDGTAGKIVRDTGSVTKLTKNIILSE